MNSWDDYYRFRIHYCPYSLGRVATLIMAFVIPSGITNLRFKPTYNPYTEPSMEVFSYHQGMSGNLSSTYRELHLKDLIL